MPQERLAMVVTGILYALAIVALPNQFLFSKTVPNSFWTECFPLPFGAGWFITFIILIPVMWTNKPLLGAIMGSVLSLFLSVLVAVPISLCVIGGTLSFNNMLSQYIWVGIICVPPLFLQIILRWCVCFYVKKRL